MLKLWEKSSLYHTIVGLAVLEAWRKGNLLKYFRGRAVDISTPEIWFRAPMLRNCQSKFIIANKTLCLIPVLKIKLFQRKHA